MYRRKTISIVTQQFITEVALDAAQLALAGRRETKVCILNRYLICSYALQYFVLVFFITFGMTAKIFKK